jgi:hypothetical protein
MLISSPTTNHTDRAQKLCPVSSCSARTSQSSDKIQSYCASEKDDGLVAVYDCGTQAHPRSNSAAKRRSSEFTMYRCVDATHQERDRVNMTTTGELEKAEASLTRPAVARRRSSAPQRISCHRDVLLMSSQR